MWGWTCLYISIALEVAATTSLRLSNNFERLHYAGLAVVLYIFCFFFLAQVLKLLPAGIAYAIWAGMGTVAIAFIGVVWFGETMNLTRGLFIAFIIVGCVGLNLTGHKELSSAQLNASKPEEAKE
jgi:small multidrug resistance pump